MKKKAEQLIEQYLGENITIYSGPGLSGDDSPISYSGFDYLMRTYAPAFARKYNYRAVGAHAVLSGKNDPGPIIPARAQELVIELNRAWNKLPMGHEHGNWLMSVIHALDNRAPYQD